MTDDEFDNNRLGREATLLSKDAGILDTPKVTKTRITINLDRDIISYFKQRGSETAKGYQTLINEALRQYVGLGSKADVLSDLVERMKRLEKKLLG
jgi:uncharacterized protein (DUF4415 family)